MSAAHTVIRRATPGDESAVFPLAAEMATSFDVRRDSFRVGFAEALAADHVVLLVAETGGAVIGYVLGLVHPTFHANGRVAWIDEIAVLPGLRRHRIGSLLMEAFERHALDGGARMVTLATRRAAGFYRAIGYTESATFFRKTFPT